MVLGPFAETKGPRRAAPKPRKYSPACLRVKKNHSIHSVQMSILIKKRGILRSIRKRHTDRTRMEWTDERNPRRSHEHRIGHPRPQRQRRPRQAVARAGPRHGPTKKEVNRRPPQQEGEVAHGGVAEHKGAGVSTAQVQSVRPAPGARPERHKAKAPINAVIHPLALCHSRL